MQHPLQSCTCRTLLPGSHPGESAQRGQDHCIAEAEIELDKTESEYQVWEEGSKPKEVSSDVMMLQKLEYIHNNPVKRGYVDDPLHWRSSSARNYAGTPGLVEVITEWG